MNTEWLIYFWGEILYGFVIILLVANVCMILFILGLAVAERILRRTLLRDPLDWKRVTDQVREIRQQQSTDEVATWR